MRKIKKGFETEFLIFKTFLKHAKMAHMYPQFRGSVNMMNRNKDLFYAIRNSIDREYHNELSRLIGVHSTYLGCRNVDNLLEIMRYSNGGRINVEYTSECQMKLMNTINGLIHSCLEYAIHDDFKILEKIGSGVFDEVCTLLFGEGFVDKTNELMNPNNDENIRKMMEGMIPLEMLRGRDGKDPMRDKAFMQWVKAMKSQRIGIDYETQGMPMDAPQSVDNSLYVPYGDYYDDDWRA